MFTFSKLSRFNKIFIEHDINGYNVLYVYFFDNMLITKNITERNLQVARTLRSIHVYILVHSLSHGVLIEGKVAESNSDFNIIYLGGNHLRFP